MGNSNSLNYRRALVPLSEEQLACIFTSHDQDRDGKLTKEELKQAFDYLGSRFSSFRANDALRVADVDGNGVITIAEMSKLIQYTKSHQYAIC